MSSPIDAAADALLAAHDTGRPIDPIAPLLPPTATIDDAYAVQDVTTRRWIAAGRRLVGRKIGLTSPAVQAQMGVNQPDYGLLFADMEYADGQVLPASRLIQPKIEGEIAFVLGRDIAAEDVTVSEVLRAIDFALPAIEVVDSRIADWRIGILDTVADNASSGLYVVGSRPVTLDKLDLHNCGMIVERAGEIVSTGVGAASLGNPLLAVKWLAQTMVKAGRPMRAGDIILSGALGPMVAVRPGDAFEIRIEGLGRVRTRIGERTE